MLTVIASILVFGFLIFIHEFGHYITARIFKVTIEEFSIGMGPRLVTWVSKKTGIRYSISLLPIGGFVSMPGENGEYNNTKTESDSESLDDGGEPVYNGRTAEEDKYANDPNTFGKKPAWQRFIITAAGATVNIVAGFLAMIILTMSINIGNTRVAQYYTDEELGMSVSSSAKLQLGDEILKVGGKRVKILDELSYEIMRKGNEPIDVLVQRDGKEVLVEDVVFPIEESQGQSFGIMDFKVNRVKKNFGSVMTYSFRKAALIVRMCWESIYDLITGRYTFAAVSGPVGISSAIGSAAKAGFTSLLYITVLISINLGVMNLLPIPALDGGRIFTLLIEMITRKKLPAKVEETINAVGLALLLGLSFIVLIKDIVQLI
ncbi:MAG: site-2 protease family protein [Ruminococcaceae bacterium]|nr:site-2 protease family protein [Oscillospiraceae bacterium]